MTIGIISDTHDNVPMIRKAVQIFNERKVDFVIHAGDLVAPFSIIPLDDLKCDYAGVFGNNDGERFGLSKRSHGKINSPPKTVELENRKILILHEPIEIIAFTKSQVYDTIVYGHTHIPAIEKQNNTLVINPCECGGWLSGRSSIALLNLDTMDAQIIEL